MLYSIGLWATLMSSISAKIPYSEYILAPSSRQIEPVSVHNVNGTVKNAKGLTLRGYGSSVFQHDSAVTFDYSKEIGGKASFYVDAVYGEGQQIGISFTESKLWISSQGSDATKDTLIDGILWFNTSAPGNYSVEPKNDRGGFRYLNLYHRGNGAVSINKLLVHFSAMPHYRDDQLRSYTGFFHSNDEKLNLVWYAAAYTNQLCAIPSELGLTLQPIVTIDNVTTEWYSNSTILEGHPTALVDGTKRDRLIWPGDLAHSLPGMLLTVGDESTIRATINRIRDLQFAVGAFPYFAAPTFADPNGADVAATASGALGFPYHCHVLTKLKQYHALTNDSAFFTSVGFDFVQRAVDWALAQRDQSGLVNASALLPLDWSPKKFAGYHTEFNSLLVYALRESADLAEAIGYSNFTVWRQIATRTSELINERLWDASVGMFRENETSGIYPQDGNTLAVIAGVTNPSRSASISKGLAGRWTPIGAPAPELPTCISPYVSGFELQSHMLAAQPQRAINLIRTMWYDYMLKDPRMTGSSFIEGYDINDTLHYPAYANDARVSHAHAWSTGPITALTSFVAGIHVLSPATWAVSPQVGDLTSVHAGFTVGSGAYEINLSARRGQLRYRLSTPTGTSGSIRFECQTCKTKLSIRSVGSGPKYHYTRVLGANSGAVKVDKVPGGQYVVESRCLRKF